MKGLKNVPEGFWVLGVLAFLFCAGFISGSIQMFAVSDMLKGTAGFPIADPNTGDVLTSIGPEVFFWMGIALVFFGVFSYFVGRGLLKAHKWSKYAAAVVAVLVLALAVVLIVYGAYSTAIFAILAVVAELWYLFFSESGKKYFK